MEAINKMNDVRHLECSHCNFRGSDDENLQIHMGTIHPECCDEMDTAGLGKLVFYQKSAKLFHCFKCFFTSKMFCNVYYHITASHSLLDKQANEINNVFSAKMEQNGNTTLEDKPLIESSEDEKSMDDSSEQDEKEQIAVPMKPEESVSALLQEQIKSKEEESSDADSNSCTLRKQNMNLLEKKGKLCNSDEDFESSDNSSTYPVVNKPAASAAQMMHIPEFSDDEDSPGLPNNIMEFSDNEETVPLPSELMDFSDNEETPAVTTNVIDFSESLKVPSVPNQMMEFSDDEETPALPEDLMDFSDNEDNPPESKCLKYPAIEESTTLSKEKEFSGDEDSRSQSKDEPECSDDEENTVLPKDVPEFSDAEEASTMSKNIPEFSDDDDDTPALPKGIPEFSDDDEAPLPKGIPEFSGDEDNTAQPKEMHVFSDDYYNTSLSKGVSGFSDNEDNSARSKDIPEFSDNEDTSTRSKDLMDFSDTEEIPTLSKDMEFSDNEENSRPKDAMMFSGLREAPGQPKGIMSYSDNEDASARPKGIMEFSDDEEISTFSKDIPKFSEDSISPTTPTQPDDVSEFSDNLINSEPVKDIQAHSPKSVTPKQAEKTYFADKITSSHPTVPAEINTPSRSKDLLEFSEDTPAQLNDSLASLGDETLVDSKDASESAEEKESLSQEETMLKYLRRAKGKYYCLMCEGRPMRKGAVLHHLVGKHNIPSPYHCKDCGKNFVLENIYKNHCMSHTEGQYKCTRCSFETNHPRGFKKHQTHCQSRHSEGANKKLFEFGENAEESIKDEDGEEKHSNTDS